MEVTVITNVNEKHEMPDRKSCQGKRCATDLSALISPTFLLTICFFIPALYDVIWNSLNSKELNLKNSTAVNESLINGTSTHNFIEEFYEAYSTTLNILTNDDKLRQSFIANFIIRLLNFGFLGLICFSVILMINTIKLIAEKSSALEYLCHFMIVSLGKTILTLIYLIVMGFLWPHSSNIKYSYLLLIMLPEVAVFLSNVNFGLETEAEVKDEISLSEVEVNNPNSKFISTLRFYIRHRNLMLFQFFNFMAMLFFMAFATIKLCDFSPLSPILRVVRMLQVGFCCMFIIFIHIYGKMVIILAKASHSLKKDDEVISLRTIFSSIITVIRYHLGSMVVHVLLFVRELLPWCYNENGINVKSNAPHIIKHLRMFTVIYGQDFKKSVESMSYFRKENKLIANNFKSKSSTVWADMLNASYHVLVNVIFYVLTESTEIVIFGGITILMSFGIIAYIYFYVVISVMNTVENTDEFCKIIKEEDVYLMDEQVNSITRISS